MKTNTLKIDYTEDSLLDKYEAHSTDHHLSINKTVQNNEVETSGKRLMLLSEKNNKHV